MLPNIHERELAVPAERIAPLLDGLASDSDGLWPIGRWPRMRLDGPLAVGARGGHGPIRYSVEEYVPGRRIVFRFAERGGLSEGLVGTHAFEVVPIDAGHTRLRHVLEGRMRGWMRLKWPLLIEPLHDALLEDTLDQAAEAVGEEPRRPSHGWRVQALRALASRLQR